MIAEKGSDLVAELWAGAEPCVSSILAGLEGRAALAQARRLGRLDADGHSHAVTEFKALQAELTLVGIDLALTEVAGGLAEEFGLRGYDAVHLAVALELGEEDTVMVSWDRDLLDAAEAVGLGVVAG